MSLQKKLDAILTAVMEARAWIVTGEYGEFTEIKFYSRHDESLHIVRVIPKATEISPADMGTWIMTVLKQSEFTDVTVKNILVRHAEHLEILNL